jgi:hypothetical protein
MADSFKVERSEDGETQTICTKIVSWKNAEIPAKYSCTRQESLNGEQLPKFVVHKHMG